MKKNTTCALILLSILLAANPVTALQTGEPTKITWDALVSEEYSPEAILAKYEKQMEKIDDDDPEAEVIYRQILAEINNAPVNEKIDKEWIKLAGFIAPLSHENEEVTEFLFVPYFGACIHVPPPPVNQTVLVKTATGHGIPLEKAFNPIWVSGRIQLKGEKTDIGEAGYRIEDALIEKYVEE